MNKVDLPKHIAIFPDGDRRWAKERGLSFAQGYIEGVERLRSVVRKANEIGIEILTFWGFSTENWKRDDNEVGFLINEIFTKKGRELKQEFIDLKVRFRHLGRKDRIPSALRKLFEELESATKDNNEKTVCIAIDYGGRDEITRAVKKIVESGVSADDINEELISSSLDTAGLPDPDMIIRTSGEHRLSGFMPWQTTYSELFFVDTYFPDFSDDQFEDLVHQFSTRERRFGGGKK